MNTSGTVKLIAIGAGKVAPSNVIGAKAHLLQQLTALGLRIPPTCVLPTGFFHPWFALLQRLPSWAAWLGGQREQWPRALLRRANTLIVLFGSTRDTPKQHNLMYQHAARKRLLVEGAKLVAAARLDRPDQVFDLTVPDLMAAGGDLALDLRDLGRQRTRFADKLETHVRTFPAVIDSRGRIQRPPLRTERPSEITGMAVSPGVVTGRVKLLRNAHEKTVDNGEALVAFTTDPGRTPLFIHAAAVILKVGGVLQHGVVVAREYGKPCVDCRRLDLLCRRAVGRSGRHRRSHADHFGAAN